MYDEKKKEKRAKTNKSNDQDLFSRFFRKRTKRLLTNIDRLFRKIMWIEIGISVMVIIIGTIFLINPNFSIHVLSVLFGMNILALGILNIFSYIKRREIPLFKFQVLYGIIGIILGIVTILNPFVFSQVITIFIGLWILYIAISKIDLGIRLQKMKESSWLILIVSAVLELFMSILVFINPFSNLLITQVAGAYLILCGVLNTMDAILTKNRAIDFLENI